MLLHKSKYFKLIKKDKKCRHAYRIVLDGSWYDIPTDVKKTISALLNKSDVVGTPMRYWWTFTNRKDATEAFTTVTLMGG